MKVRSRPAMDADRVEDNLMIAQTAPQAPLAETASETPHVARVGVKDTGHNVTTVCGEAVDGRIADLADGDA